MMFDHGKEAEGYLRAVEVHLHDEDPEIREQAKLDLDMGKAIADIALEMIHKRQQEIGGPLTNEQAAVLGFAAFTVTMGLPIVKGEEDPNVRVGLARILAVMALATGYIYRSTQAPAQVERWSQLNQGDVA